jgi:hypothetical protein
MSIQAVSFAKEFADAFDTATTSQHPLTRTAGRSSFCVDKECDRLSWTSALLQILPKYKLEAG